jgi:hypothetical protein
MKRFTVTAIIGGENINVETDKLMEAINVYRAFYNYERCTCADITDNRWSEVMEYFTREEN